MKDALKKQIDLLCHTSNLYFHESCGEAAKKLNEISEMDRVFFTNSGTEAIEGALKSARKYAYTKESGRYEIIDNAEFFPWTFHRSSFGDRDQTLSHPI